MAGTLRRSGPGPDPIGRAIAGVDQAVGRLVDRLDDGVGPAQWAVIFAALARCGPAGVEGLAARLARARDPRRRVRLAAALGGVGGAAWARRPALAALAGAMRRERDGAARAMVEVSLGALAPTADERAWLLACELADDDSAARARARRARVVGRRATSRGPVCADVDDPGLPDVASRR